MKIETGNKESKTSVALSTQKAGSGKVFRFATDAFDKAIEEKLFYCVGKEPNTRENQVRIINITTGEILYRDNVSLVIEHEATLTIYP